MAEDDDPRDADDDPKDEDDSDIRDEIERLKGALDKERSARRKAERLARSRPDVDEDELAELRRLKREADERKGVKEGDLEKAVEARTAELQEELKTLRAANEELGATAETLAVDNAFRAAASSVEGFRREAVSDALVIAKLPDDQGRRWSREGTTPVLRDSDGNIVYGKDATTPLTPAEWLQQMSEARPHWFGESRGGGAHHQSGGKSGASNRKRSEMSPDDVSAYIDEHGSEAYLKLPA